MTPEFAGHRGFHQREMDIGTYLRAPRDRHDQRTGNAAGGVGKRITVNLSSRCRHYLKITRINGLGLWPYVSNIPVPPRSLKS